MTTSSIWRRLTLAGVLGAFAACAAPDITDPLQRSGGGAKALFDPELVECDASATTSNSAVVTALGGVVTAGGTSISIPAGALLAPATVTVTVPTGQYMEVDVSVEGTEHFLFELPVAITLDYSRCSNQELGWGPLSVWYIDSDTHELLENMVAIDNRLAKKITFVTGHLSGYAIAN